MLQPVQQEDRILRWFIGDFTLTPQYFASSLSVNCHDSQFHRLPTISSTYGRWTAKYWGVSVKSPINHRIISHPSPVTKCCTNRRDHQISECLFNLHNFTAVSNMKV